ncbi:uncharacterized protein [Haliotis asinina]|uniref:uncharacterized protein n=1 Tax=Haliotis asinina TaxID=109174 RepID=UPI00353269A5
MCIVSPPMVRIGSWNQYQRTLDGLPRTNNHLKGWHRRLLTNMSGCHPSIWRFLDVLRREQALNDQVITQMLSGLNIARSKKQYRDCQQRLQSIATDYPNRRCIDFLRSVAGSK